MSLITEINRTETNKNKTKQVAINIDNKLVELGGEQAIDLSDVPNKIDALIPQYSRYAEVSAQAHTLSSSSKITLPMNLTFEPKEVFISIKEINRDGSWTGNVESILYLTKGTSNIQVYFNGMQGRIFNIKTSFDRKGVYLDITLPSTNKYTFVFNKIYVIG